MTVWKTEPSRRALNLLRLNWLFVKIGDKNSSCWPIVPHFIYLFFEREPKKCQVPERKYRLAGVTKKEKSFIDPTVGKFTEICHIGTAGTG